MNYTRITQKINPILHIGSTTQFKPLINFLDKSSTIKINPLLSMGKTLHTKLKYCAQI